MSVVPMSGLELIFKPFLSWRHSRVPFWEIFNFHLEKKGCPVTYERQDYEAVAG